LVKKVDVSKAKALPGVKAVITGADFPNKIGLYLKDKTILATDRVRFIGEGVAAVAAISNEIAMKALDLIDVEYEELEPVFDPEYGASKEAPLIHPNWANIPGQISSSPSRERILPIISRSRRVMLKLLSQTAPMLWSTNLKFRISSMYPLNRTLL
jgi:CO/xanthine dehydrogenase Mo-binding subunit